MKTGAQVMNTNVEEPKYIDESDVKYWVRKGPGRQPFCWSSPGPPSSGSASAS